MDKKLEYSVREQLQHYALAADDAARNIQRKLTALAADVEYRNQHSSRYDLNVDDMDDRYESRKDEGGNLLYIRSEKHEPGEVICLAAGVPQTPFTAETKRKLRNYEQLAPTLLRMYDELDYVDELWVFDREANIAVGRVDYHFAHVLFPGLDLNSLYDAGITFYDWFRASDLQSNPDRRVVCSASPFVEMFNQWILHLKAPFYRNRYGQDETFIGIATVHLKLPWLMRNTIDTSNLRLMVIKDNSTLIAMNPAAEQDIDLATYNFGNFSMDAVFQPAVWQCKRKLVSEVLNLEHNKPDDVTCFARKVKSEYSFTHTLQGRSFQVIREESRELGCNFVALLDKN